MLSRRGDMIKTCGTLHMGAFRERELLLILSFWDLSEKDEQSQFNLSLNSLPLCTDQIATPL